MKRLLILSSGGDAPGMNAAIRAVVRTASYYGIEVYGAHNGYAGLVNHNVTLLSTANVANCIQRGGTILKTGRLASFHQKITRHKAMHYLNELGIDALVVLGGNGSFAGAAKLCEEGGPPIVGIPCTIDNDIQGTEYTIGFDTACNTALNAIDKVRDTALSFERNFLIEVMGRSSGFIAINVGIAGGAELIITPEFPISAKEISEKLHAKKRKKEASIIVVAESNKPGHSFDLAKELKKHANIEYRVCVLGHTQRGGMPTAKDRIMGSIMGAEAVEYLRKKSRNRMIAYNKEKIEVVSLPDPEHGTRYFDDKKLLRANEIICDIY